MSDRLPITLESEALAMLRELVSEVRELRADLAGRSAPRVDDATAHMVKAIWAAVADRVFTAADLVVHADLPSASALKAAIKAVTGAMNARRIGKVLGRVEGVDVGGLTVRRVGDDRDGVLWAVNATLRVSNPR